MKQVALMRHAEALPAGAGEYDYQRPLSEQGECDAALIGRRLARNFRFPDAVLASPARRTRRTAEIVAAQLAFPPADIQFEARAYEARISDLCALLQDLDDALERVVLVAHNPAISGVCTYLLQEWVADLPSGACAQLTLDIESWAEVQPGCGRLQNLDHPFR
ncbi:hypothetical protein CAI21_17950 [Alkalilimnicola ehrlichii]|uniref:Phosphohistidine phosphatase, SixA n=1 Tax=Alkalilimnicola ehrlichii TaxID=351052 RepID=A0A3E0WJI3_9GAMM|nr:histidine phosphatase family protein [Alkalilimnicola ehrlichii]RFA25842.1 hypothetical protein CAI21_17950 [Alkalilimnicola ehrlichii]RFA33104.1 hypothetical protein CAL65_18235 [Alkalilimnicola ehrlichii]